MKVLIVVTRNPHYSLLITLHTKELREEIRDLVSRRKNSMAMATALSRGRFEREVAHNEMQDVKADLMLSVDSSNWDLMK
jgi:superfamily I DNA and RNA helicase